MSLQRIAITPKGGTIPFIISGTEIILIQDSTVQVGRFIVEEYDFGGFYIEHPLNAEALNKEALNIINQEPGLLKTKSSIVVVCPQNISKKCFWEGD